MYHIHRERGEREKGLKAQTPGILSKLTDSEVMGWGPGLLTSDMFPVTLLGCVNHQARSSLHFFYLLFSKVICKFYSWMILWNSSPFDCKVIYHCTIYFRMLTIHINRWVLSILSSSPTEILVTLFLALVALLSKDDITFWHMAFWHPHQVTLCITLEEEITILFNH